MTKYPDTTHFTGLNAPVNLEWEVEDLPVLGDIPTDIDGAFFRAVPDFPHPPMFEDEIGLSGDGMISKFTIHEGKVGYAIRYVETDRYKLEKDAGRALFGRYRNPFTDDPSIEGRDRTVANTTPVWHAGRLFMTKEDGLGYEIDPETLQTLGRWDYFGSLKSETFTAHPRIDPETGEMFFFGYEAGGLCTDDVAYCIADKDGRLVSEQWFKQPYCSSIHDFVITEKYAIFPIFPTTANIDRLKEGGAHWAHQQELESWVGIMPRYGKVEELRWFKGRPGISAFHMINAFDDGNLIHIDLHVSDTCAFGFMREAGGIDIPQQEIGGGTMRWTIDTASDAETYEERPIGPPGDMPRLRDADQGRRHETAWYMTLNPQGGPPLPGGPVGFAFNALVEIAPDRGGMDLLGLDRGMGLNEPVHVPSRQDGHPGWLLFVVDRQVGEGDHFVSELWIVEAGNISAGPVARVPLPERMRSQVHGTWVPTEQLKQARARASA